MWGRLGGNGPGGGSRERIRGVSWGRPRPQFPTGKASIVLLKLLICKIIANMFFSATVHCVMSRSIASIKRNEGVYADK